MTRFTTITIITVIFLLATLAGNVLGVNYYTSPVPTGQSSLGFSFLGPAINSWEQWDFFTGNFLLNGHFAVSPKVSLNLVIPLSRASYETIYYPWDAPPRVYKDTQHGLGNILVQCQIIHNQSQSGKSWLSLEFFAPTSKRRRREVLAVGGLAHMHYQQLYFAEVWSFGVQYARFSKFGPSNSAYNQYELGGRMSISSQGSRTEFILHYAFALGLDNSEFSIGTELLGQFHVTGNNMSFTERTMNQIVFGLTYVKSSFQPKLYYQIPLDDDHNNIIGSVLGLGFDIVLNKGDRKSAKW